MHAIGFSDTIMPMATPEPSLTIGIEEEYLLVDTGDARPRRRSAGRTDGRVPEARSASQVDARSSCAARSRSARRCATTLAEARPNCARLRRTIAEQRRQATASRRSPPRPIRSPTGARSSNTDKDRYNELARDMQVVARRLLICGMHVHVGIEDEALRIDLFNQLPYFLPHLLALSTSSPFWRGERPGCSSYRLAVFNELPRTGLPPTFADVGEYHRTVDTLVKAGEIEDGTKIWWDLRPSARFPTLEMRITDVCTRLDDAIAIAALYRCSRACSSACAAPTSAGATIRASSSTRTAGWRSASGANRLADRFRQGRAGAVRRPASRKLIEMTARGRRRSSAARRRSRTRAGSSPTARRPTGRSRVYDAATAAGARKTGSAEARRRSPDRGDRRRVPTEDGRHVSFGEFENRFARYRVGDADAAAEVLEHVAHTVEAGDHCRARGDD